MGLCGKNWVSVLTTTSVGWTMDITKLCVVSRSKMTLILSVVKRQNLHFFCMPDKICVTVVAICHKIELIWIKLLCIVLLAAQTIEKDRMWWGAIVDKCIHRRR